MLGSERLLKTMAELMVTEGYKDAGYQYVVVDDCWLASKRDAQGKLQPDPDRFPSGVKALADYVSMKWLTMQVLSNALSNKDRVVVSRSAHFASPEKKTFLNGWTRFISVFIQLFQMTIFHKNLQNFLK